MLLFDYQLPNKAGYIEVETNGKRTYCNTTNNLLIDNEPPLTQEQLREQAYNFQKIILWDNKTLTVTEAATKWAYYAAENSEKASQLTNLIIEAKAKIREIYPDD